MATPLVSVIIPSWRHERYIQECIEAIISQSYGPIELLPTERFRLRKAFARNVRHVSSAP